MRWATSKDYVKLVGDTEGWVAAPPGTRKSTYENPEYQKAAPFAPIVLNAIMVADPTHATKDPVPYTGVQFVDHSGIPGHRNERRTKHCRRSQRLDYGRGRA